MDLDPDAWLVTVGEGVMEACSVLWVYKHLPLRDWLAYSEKFGLPYRHVLNSGKAVKIEIRENKPDAAFTMIHEIGHLLHQQIFSEHKGGHYSSLASNRELLATLEGDLFSQVNTGWYTEAETDAMTAKRDTVESMLELQQALADTPEVKAIKAVTRGPFLGEALKARKDTEIWPRAYTQYIAQKSQDPTLLANLNVEHGRFFKEYWSDENFRPVAKVFDKLFRSKGWLQRPQPK